jgi:FKBP-type peptidyl-prolyl cis-trans isomerase
MMPTLLVFAWIAQLALVSSLSTVSPQATINRRHAVVTASAAAIAGLGITGVPPILVSNAMSDLSDFKDGPEGLKYKVLEKGTGPKPQRGQKIQTSYTLWINGFPGDVGKAGEPSKQVDSTTKPLVGDTPFILRAGTKSVIRGWDLTLLDMKEGETRRLVIPPSLAYGDRGIGPIPAKATLFFEMKLTKVEKMEPLTEEAKKWLEEHPL